MFERIVLGAGIRVIVLTLGFCLMLNVCLGYFSPALNNLLYLDMVGTALCAFMFGPWYGALVALATQVLLAVLRGNGVVLDYAIVNVIGALIWGFLPALGLDPTKGKSPRFGRVFVTLFLQGLIAGVACSVAGTAVRTDYRMQINGDAPITWNTPENIASDRIFDSLAAQGAFDQLIYLPALLADFVAAIPDKVISTFLGFLIACYVVRHIQTRQVSVGSRVAEPVARRRRWVAMLVFLGAFALYMLLTQGIPGNLMQAVLWFLPVMLGVIVEVLLASAGAKRRRAVPIDVGPPTETAKLAYDDLMDLMVAFYLIVASFSLRNAAGATVSSPMLGDVVGNGIGVAGVLIILKFGPHFISRLLERKQPA